MYPCQSCGVDIKLIMTRVESQERQLTSHDRKDEMAVNCAARKNELPAYMAEWILYYPSSTVGTLINRF
jgi:hypothetical protein